MSGNTQIHNTYYELFGTYNDSISPAVTFGTSLYETNEGMFYSFQNIAEVVCEGTSQIPYYTEKTFLRKSNIDLFVPEGYVDTYVNDYYWKGFKSVTDSHNSSEAIDCNLEIPFPASVYNIGGIRMDVTPDTDFQSLPSGIYIINGEKIMLK